MDSGCRGARGRVVTLDLVDRKEVQRKQAPEYLLCCSPLSLVWRSGVCEASGLGDLFWWWYVVVGAGQQESEEGERKQEREDQRPTDSRKKKRSGPKGSGMGA